MAAHLNKLTKWPGVYGTLSFTEANHNGYPDNEVVMCEANSFRNGAFSLAPGYSA
jgi:branched-chain amino acid transport system substrate-binding protein